MLEKQKGPRIKIQATLISKDLSENIQDDAVEK